MTTFNRYEEQNTTEIKNSSDDPRLLRRLVYVNCAFILLAFGMLLIGSETEQRSLALAGLVSVCLGTLGWLAMWIWMLVLLVRDIRSIQYHHGSFLRWLLSRGGRDNKIDPQSDQG